MVTLVTKHHLASCNHSVTIIFTGHVTTVFHSSPRNIITTISYLVRFPRSRKPPAELFPPAPSPSPRPSKALGRAETAFPGHLKPSPRNPITSTAQSPRTRESALVFLYNGERRACREATT